MSKAVDYLLDIAKTDDVEQLRLEYVQHLCKTIVWKPPPWLCDWDPQNAV